MKSNKRGMLSIFIIIGVIVLFLIIVSISAMDFSFDSEGTDAERFYDNCLESVSLQGMKLIASRGGVLQPGTTVDGLQMKKGKIDKGLFEEELEGYINSHMHLCNYSREGRNVSTGTPRANVSIREQKTDVKLHMEVNISTDTSHSVYQYFDAEHEFKLGEMIEVMNRSIDCFDPAYLEDTGFEARKHPGIITLKNSRFYLAAGYE